MVADVDWLGRLVAAVEDGNYRGAGGRMLESFQETLADRWRARIMPQHHGENSADHLFIFGCNSIYSRELLQSVGGYDENCKTAFDDIDIWSQIRKSGNSTRYVADALCYHHRRDTIDSVLNSCYSWRKPGYERSGSFEKIDALATKWVASTNSDLELMFSLEKESLLELAKVSIIGIFRHCLKDLVVSLDRHPESAAELLPCGAGMTAILILDMTSSFPNIRRILLNDIENYIATCDVLSRSEAPSAFRQIKKRTDRIVADQLLLEVGVRETQVLAPFFVVLPWLAAELKTIYPILSQLETSDWRLE